MSHIASANATYSCSMIETRRSTAAQCRQLRPEAGFVAVPLCPACLHALDAYDITVLTIKTRPVTYG